MAMYQGKVSFQDLHDPCVKDEISKALLDNGQDTVSLFYKELFNKADYPNSVLSKNIPQLFISNKIIRYESGIYTLEELKNELDKLLADLRKQRLHILADLLENIFNNITHIESFPTISPECDEKMVEIESHDELENETVGLFDKLEGEIQITEVIPGLDESVKGEILNRIKDFVRRLKNRKTISIRLGSYVPEDNIIVLYVNAIYSSFLPMLKTRTFDEFFDCVRIVFIHELTHALHYYSMGYSLWDITTRPGNKRLSVIESIASFAEYYWCYLLRRKGAAAQAHLGKWKCDKLIYMYTTFDYPECPYAAAGVFIYWGCPDLRLYNRVFSESISNTGMHWWNAYELIKKHDHRKLFLGF